MAAKLGDALIPGVHYEVFEKQKTITLNEEGARYAETALDVKDLYDPSNPWAAYVVNAIKARTMHGCMGAWMRACMHGDGWKPSTRHPPIPILPSAPSHRSLGMGRMARCSLAKGACSLGMGRILALLSWHGRAPILPHVSARPP
jgi:hypothetical protein